MHAVPEPGKNVHRWASEWKERSGVLWNTEGVTVEDVIQVSRYPGVTFIYP